MGKKHKHAPHENLERWVVSYADFMTLLFAVFTALFAMAKAEVTEKQEVVEEIRQGFVDQSLMAGIKSIIQGKSAPNNNPNPLSQERGEGEGLMGDFKELTPQKGTVDPEDQNKVGEEGLDAIYQKLANELEEINKALQEGAQMAAGEGTGEGTGKGAGGGQGNGPDSGGEKGLGAGAGAGLGKEGKGGKPTLDDGGGQQKGSGDRSGAGEKNGHGKGGEGAGDSSSTDGSKEGLNNVQVSADKRGVRIRFDSRILFHSGSASLRPEAKKALSLVAKKLEKYKGKYLFQVEGHTDNQRIRSSVYPSNWELSTARASSVVRLFINEFKYPAKVMSAAGYGDSRPIGDNKTAAGRSKNRRIEFLLFTDPEQDAGKSSDKHNHAVKKSIKKPKIKNPSRLEKQLLQKITVHDDNQPVKVILMQRDAKTGEIIQQHDMPIKSVMPTASTEAPQPMLHATDRIPFDDGHVSESHGHH